MNMPVRVEERRMDEEGKFMIKKALRVRMHNRGGPENKETMG